jgi:hypothetical protein
MAQDVQKETNHSALYLAAAITNHSLCIYGNINPGFISNTMVMRKFSHSLLEAES